MTNTTEQYVDPVVSRFKFDRELAEYRSFEADYRKRGWFLVMADWPLVIVVLASNKTSPPAIVTAVQFDYTNYDAEPPSVRMVDPFNGRLLKDNELPIRLKRTIEIQQLPFPGPDGQNLQAIRAMDLMQTHDPEEPPFLCIPGVKEYHDHPGHSGDPWEIHRSTGEGRLVRLLEVISKYSIDTVTGYNVNFVPQITLGVGPEPPQ